MPTSEQRSTRKSGTLYRFEIETHPDIAPNDLEDYIKVLLSNYRLSAPLRNVEIVEGPFASVQEHLFDNNKDIIVRAIVVPAKKDKGFNAKVNDVPRKR